MSRASGATLVEVLVAAFVLVALAVPLLAMVQTGNRESVASENQMFAELLALSTIERWMRVEYRTLERQLPVRTTFEGVPENETIAGLLPVFRSKFTGPLAFKTDLRVSKVRDGLLGIEVAVRWGSSWAREEHRFALARLKAQEDLSLERRYRTAQR